MPDGDYAIITDMEPEAPVPRLNPEQAPVQYGQTVERGPLPQALELGGIETGAERREQVGDVARNTTPVAPTPVLPSVVPATTVDEPVAVADDHPTVAADEDLIEKEWVDKAKKIITETRDDPHAREKKVSQLQADYLKKRYGKELGATD